MHDEIRDLKENIEKNSGFTENPVSHVETIGTCDGVCNRNLKRVYYTDGTDKVTGCVCETIRKEQSIIRRRKSEGFKANSKIPYTEAQADFSRFQTDGDKEKVRVLEIMKRYANNFGENMAEGNPSNLMVIGTPGTGKTMLASSIFYEVARQGYKVFFIDSQTYLESMKDSFDDKSIKYKLRKFIEEADLLVFDDVGVGLSNNSDWATNQLFEVTNARIGKFTIYTTNLTFKEFTGDKALSRAFSRMAENAFPVKMNFTDKRIEGMF